MTSALAEMLCYANNRGYTQPGSAKGLRAVCYNIHHLVCCPSRLKCTRNNSPVTSAWWPSRNISVFRNNLWSYACTDPFQAMLHISIYEKMIFVDLRYHGCPCLSGLIFGSQSLQRVIIYLCLRNHSVLGICFIPFLGSFELWYDP